MNKERQNKMKTNTEYIEIIDIVSEETPENEILGLFNQITADVINTRSRYNKTYMMLIVKSETGALSADIISTAITELDADFSGINTEEDDSYLDAVYYEGRHIAAEFDKMGFPLGCNSHNGADTLQDYTGPLGVVCISPDHENLSIVYETIEGCGSLTGISFDYRIEFDAKGNAYMFDLTGTRAIPEWIHELSDGISDYCHNK